LKFGFGHSTLKLTGGLKVHQSISELEHAPGPVVLAIGVFDGVHLGHRSVLERAQSEAQRIGGTAVPLSFDPHPARFLRPDAAPLLLTATEHKLALFKSMGFSHTLLLPFNASVAATSADAFIESLASAARPLAAICVGQEWSFGKGRQGNLERLSQLGAQLNFAEIGVPEVQVDGEPVSSTRIRKNVALGQLEEVERLLGRPYSVIGQVIHGKALGRTIGFPTANLALLEEQLPPNGVYAVQVRSGSFIGPRVGIANLGTRPTIDPNATQPSLEVHLLDFSGDLYGQVLEVEFSSYLRPEQKFASVEMLTKQIQQDASIARAYFSRRTPRNG
jgi:riboflavin kinase/FMN adenylyltransferase